MGILEGRVPEEAWKNRATAVVAVLKVGVCEGGGVGIRSPLKENTRR